MMTDWIMWQTVATIILGIGTIVLAVISATVLYKSYDQNRKMLEHNSKILDRMELDQRPYLSEDSIDLSDRNHWPVFNVKNIGGKGAIISEMNLFMAIRGYQFSLTERNNHIIRPQQTFYKYMFNENWKSFGPNFIRDEYYFLVTMFYRHEDDAGNQNSSTYKMTKTIIFTEDEAEEWNETIEKLYTPPR